MQTQKIAIKDLTLAELKKIIVSSGFEQYRAEQIFDKIYKKRTDSFENMLLIPSKLRDFLAERFQLSDFKDRSMRQSVDGSIKFLFTLLDGNSIETVFMPWLDDETNETIRNTICVSTMAGCPLDCAFCATASLGFRRKLTCSEIIGQIFETEKMTNEKISNVVYMGMGEPLLNYENTIKSIRIITSEKHKLISNRRITVSTAGILKGIEKLAEENLKIKLALSLHATTDEGREKIMKTASKNVKLSEILDALELYYKKSKIKLTFEYIVFDGFNDSREDAIRLAKISRRVPSTINIIPFNDISHTTQIRKTDISLHPASQQKIDAFVDTLRKNGAIVNVRKSFGQDIEAACGQLASSMK